MHLVARRVGTARLTTGRYSRCLVIPRGEESASFADREVRLPLRLGRIGVGVQQERRTKGHPAISGADVVDVARVGTVGSGIDIANYLIQSGRLPPAHVPPVSRTAVHTGEVARITAVRADESRPGVGVRPSVAAVGGAINFVVAV